MHVPHRPPPAGRARLTAIIAIALLIGVGGALLVPRLLHRGAELSGQGEVAFLATSASGFLEPGTFRLSIARPGHPPLDLTLATKPPHEPPSLKDAFLELAQDAGMAEATVVGPLLTLPGIRAIGGDPGRSGAALSLGLAGARDGIRLRIEASGPPSEELIIRVSLTATGVLQGGATRSPTTAFSRDLPSGSAPEVAHALAAELRQVGWDLDEADVASGRLVLRHLPGGHRVEAVRLDVAYLYQPPEETAGPTWFWTLSL